MEKVAGYVTLDGMVEKLFYMPPERREQELRRWIIAPREEQDRLVAEVMAKLKEREMR